MTIEQLKWTILTRWTRPTKGSSCKYSQFCWKNNTADLIILSIDAQ